MRVRAELGGPKKIGGTKAADPMSPNELLLVEVDLVHLDVVLPFVRHSVFRKDRANGTDGLAGTAVDALIGVDEVHVVRVGRINAVNRAHVYAACVLQIH